MSQWYKQSKWRNLVDMHIPDWHADFLSRFDGNQYAELLSTSEADCAIFYAGNCLGYCFWPTKAGHMHKGLSGRDIVAETLAACRAKGMRTVVYFNIWNRYEFDRHPDWRMRTIDGRDTTCNLDGTRNRYGVCCLNAPGFRTFIQAQIHDLIDHYACDGFWIDMIGWNGTICYCPACRRRYLDETGEEMPEKIDWYDPAWVRFQRKREVWFTDFTRLIDEIVRARCPEATVAYQCATALGGWVGAASQDFLNLSDYLAGDFDSNARNCSTICKILSSMTRNKPVEFMTARCVSLADHTTIKPYQQFRQNVYTALARNCAFCFIDAIDPVGTMNRAFYEQMGALHREMQPYQAAIEPDATLLRDVSVYFNLESGVDVSMNGKHISVYSDTIWGSHIGTQLPRLKNLAQSLTADHLTYDLACWNSRADMLQGSRVIIVPNQLMLDEQEISVLRQFAEDGGSLIITARTGYCDKTGQIRRDGLLSDWTGITIEADTAEDVVYFRPTQDGAALLAPYDANYPLAIARTGQKVRAAADVQVLARLTLPYSHSQEIHTFGSAISNPPGYDTEYPAITLRQVGRGKVMYLAAPLEEIEHAAQRQILCRLARHLIGPTPLLETNAPEWLEFYVYQVQQGGYLIYGCKTMEAYYEAEAEQVTLTLRLPGPTGRLIKIPTGECVAYTAHDGILSWTEAKIGDFIMYRLESGSG